MKNVKKVNLDGLYMYIETYETLLDQMVEKKKEYDQAEKKIIDLINEFVDPVDTLGIRVKKRRQQKSTSEYKALMDDQQELKKTIYLIDLEKKVVKCNLERLIELKTMESIAINWDLIKGVPYHYKKFINIINESISSDEIGYKVYLNACVDTLTIRNYYDANISRCKRADVDAYIYLRSYERDYGDITMYDRKYHIDDISDIKKDIELYSDKLINIMTLKKQYEKNVADVLQDVSNETIKSDLMNLNGWDCWEWEM